MKNVLQIICYRNQLEDCTYLRAYTQCSLIHLHESDPKTLHLIGAFVSAQVDGVRASRAVRRGDLLRGGRRHLRGGARVPLLR
eukprot:786289-Prorocentrum_minimum.AAC.1